jgi:GMP synthase-like glutamine amidotransferase
MKVLIIEHAPGRSDGIDKFAQNNNYDYHVWKAHSEPMPLNFKNFDKLIVGGGPMSAYSMNELDFFKNEKKIIQYYHDLGLPIFGICLGAQIIAELFGGKVEKGITINGWQKINLALASKNDSLFDTLLPTITSFQFHSDYITQLPNECFVTASSTSNPIEGFSFINKPISTVQFHPEISPTKAREIFSIKYGTTGNFSDWKSTSYQPKVSDTIFRNFLKKNEK